MQLFLVPYELKSKSETELTAWAMETLKWLKETKLEDVYLFGQTINTNEVQYINKLKGLLWY